jgi:F-type H+-transporting ATPase subunit b
MPQFDFETFIPQLAWLALFFAILYFGIVRFTLPRLGRVMTTREQTIEGDIADAERAKGEADMIRERYSAEVAEVHRGAQASIAAAKAAAAGKVQARLAEAQAGIDRKLDAAAAELAEARKRAVGEIGRIAGEAAADIVARLTGAAPSPDALKAALQTEAIGA